MDVNELLVRTMNASKEAEKNGFYETADAFDAIVDGLLEMLSSRVQPERETPAIMPPVLHNMH